MLGVLRDAGGCSDNALARRWQWAISLWKNQGLDSAGAAGAAASDDERVAARVMQVYEQRLSAFQAVDFDDLIGLPLKLLQRDAEARGKWQEQFHHVLVDEVQDTNAVQYELLKALVEHPDERRHGLFTAVGDDDQSIYGWRGATIDNLKRLPQDFPKLKLIALEQNYRSTGHILRAANHVIANNPKLFEKKLWSELGDGEPVRVLECDGEEHEAERAVARIQSLRRARHGAGEVQRLRHPLPRQPPGPGVRAEAARRADPLQGVGRAELLRPRRDQGPVRLAAPAGQSGRRPGLPARRGHAQARHRRDQTLASLGDFAGKWKVSLFEALFSPTLASALSAKAIGSLHEFGRYVNDLEHRARHTLGAEDAKALLLGWLEGHRLRAAPARRRGQRQAGRGALGQRARFRRLGRAALRRRDRRRTAGSSRARSSACCRWRRPSASSSAWPSAATTATW